MEVEAFPPLLKVACSTFVTRTDKDAGDGSERGTQGASRRLENHTRCTSVPTFQILKPFLTAPRWYPGQKQLDIQYMLKLCGTPTMNPNGLQPKMLATFAPTSNSFQPNYCNGLECPKDEAESSSGRTAII